MTSCPVYKLGEVGQEGWITARELTGHRSASGEQLHCASLVLYILFFFSPSFSVLLNCLYLNPQVLLFFSILSPIPLGGGSEQAAAWCLIAGWG